MTEPLSQIDPLPVEVQITVRSISTSPPGVELSVSIEGGAEDKVFVGLGSTANWSGWIKLLDKLP